MPRIVLEGDKHGCAILAAMNDMQQEGLLQDVTLSCEDQQLRLHQIVLAAFSPYFRRILQHIAVPHPVLKLDVPYADLLLIVECLYQGSAAVPPEQLSSVLLTAEMLMIRGVRMEAPPAVPRRAAPIDDGDQQPGPSGLGRPRVRFATADAEVPSLVSLMHGSSLAENDGPQDEPERMELWPDAEIAYALEIVLPDSTGDGEEATAMRDRGETQAKEHAADDEDEPMDIDPPRE